MTVIYDAYGEDGDFQYLNCSIGGGVAIVGSGSNQIRNGSNSGGIAYARSGVQFTNRFAAAQRIWPVTLATGWCGARIWCQPSGIDSPNKLWGLTDASGVLRIFIMDTSNGTPGAPYNVFKVSANGTQTQLGTTTSGFSSGPGMPDQFSANWNYAANGFLALYINSYEVFSYQGDITTDGVTALGGSYHSTYQTGGEFTTWSECVVSDSDTRNMSVRTTVAAGAGTEDQWTGQAGNVNNATVNDGVFDTTETAGAIQRYTMGQISATNEVVLAKVTNLRAGQGGGSLTHLALAELIGGTAYQSDPVPFPAAFAPVQFIQPNNPATGQPWTFADLNAQGRESGYQADA